MNEFENQEVVEQVGNPQVEDTFQETEVVEQFTTEENNDTATTQDEENEEFSAQSDENVSDEEALQVEVSQSDALQIQFNELQIAFDELQQQFEDAQSHIAELEQFQNSANEQIEALNTRNEELQSTIASYEAKEKENENIRKDELINKYEKVLESEEITVIRNSIKDFSYDELESKLAIQFANQQLAHEEEVKKVPLIEPQESQFALLMKNYRKN